MACGLSQLEEQGLIDPQRSGRIGPLIPGDAMAEHHPRRQGRHLLDEGRRRQAALAPAEPIPLQAGAEASLGVAALITGERTGGGAGEPAGAGDSDRAGFAVARWEGQGGSVGLGRGHG